MVKLSNIFVFINISCRLEYKNKKSDPIIVTEQKPIKSVLPKNLLLFTVFLAVGVMSWGLLSFIGYTGKVDTLTSIVMMFSGAFIFIVSNTLLSKNKEIKRNIQGEIIRRTDKLEKSHRKFRMITDNAYDLITIVNPEGEYEYLNSAYHRILGYSRDEMKEQNIFRYIHPADVNIFKRTIQEIAEGKNAVEIQYRMLHTKGNWVHLEGVAKGLHDADWSETSIVINSKDVTNSKKYAEKLAKSEQRFRDFSESSADWLWEVDDSMEFSYVSSGIKNVMGYTPEEMIGRIKFEALFDDNESTVKSLLENRINRRQPYRGVEFWSCAKNGERICLRISGVPVFDENHNYIGYRGAATNITTSKLDREHMFRLATTDHLTSLLNRNRFMEELERTVSLAKRHGTEGVLLFIDLDQFKHTNDSYGHDAGDVLLRAVAGVLKKGVRSTDIIARLGGDEFGIIMHKVSVEKAREKVQTIIDEINKLDIRYKDVKLGVTMSIGMIAYPQEGQDGSDLFMGADLAMYRAKDMGRNRMFVHSNDAEDSSDWVKNQLKWLEILRSSLETGSFEMHYQPLVPATKQKKPLFECLIRLRDEDGNIGLPYLFIDAAEHFGLIHKLDLKVLEKCLQNQSDFRDKGMDVDFSINLSSRSIGDPEVVNALRDIIEKEDVDPSSFILEVTETAAIHDPSAHRELKDIKVFIDELRDMGFRFALDDFGVGFSSFNYIRELNVDVLKIDGSYIKDINKSKQDQLFTHAMTDLAQGMNITTVAEFVEDEHIMQVLLDMGVDYGQGYYFSKPEWDMKTLYKQFNGKCMPDFLPKHAKNLVKTAKNKTVEKKSVTKKKVVTKKKIVKKTTTAKKKTSVKKKIKAKKAS